MKRLAIAVEGPTERVFVQNLLGEHLRSHDVDTTAVSLNGNVRVDRVAEEMAYLLRNHNAVSCFVDFYGFRHKGDATVEELEEKIRRAVQQSAQWRQGRRVVAYVQQHEFEALLFSEVRQFGVLRGASPGLVARLQGIRDSFATPEDIDDEPETAPSKRILAEMPRYNKVWQGREVALAIGLETMRAECPRFDAWVARLESLGSRTPRPSRQEARSHPGSTGRPNARWK